MLRKLWNQASFRYSLLSALIWGLAAHAYAFFHDFFSHDALNAMVATPVEEHWKIELGRFLFPLYRTIIRNSLALPWIIGLFTILWAALALYLLSRIFRLKRSRRYKIRKRRNSKRKRSASKLLVKKKYALRKNASKRKRLQRSLNSKSWAISTI